MDFSSSSRPPQQAPMVLPDIVWFLAYHICGAFHELAHVGMAYTLGYSIGGLPNDDDSSIDQLQWWLQILWTRTTRIDSMQDAPERHIALVRHAGWVASLALFATLWFLVRYSDSFTKGGQLQLRQSSSWSSWSPLVASTFLSVSLITFFEALSTDVFGFTTQNHQDDNDTTTIVFECGNFGILLLHDAWIHTPGDHGQTALDLLEQMISITMMRGAQTGGVLAWKHPTVAPTPVRVRVVNGKRTDLSKELRASLDRTLCGRIITRGGRIDPSVRLLLGHTRFATSSKATLDGTHPHTWSPPQVHKVYSLAPSSTDESYCPQPKIVKVSNYITHNGDLDFFKAHGHHAPLDDIQQWLVHATGYPMTTTVDSAAIAGLVDIIRTAGCFALSIRFAYLLDMPDSRIIQTNNTSHMVDVPKAKDYELLAQSFESMLRTLCQTKKWTLPSIRESNELRQVFADHVVLQMTETPSISQMLRQSKAFGKYYSWEGPIAAVSVAAGAPQDIEQQKLSFPMLRLWIRKSIDAFFDNDLFFTTKYFMKHAIGSFGLVITSSMDAHGQICIAARGQPMSIAFYPEKGLVCYGSEMAAAKAGMQYNRPGNSKVTHFPSQSFDLHSPHDGPASSTPAFRDHVTGQTCRFDLDDLGGEVVLLDWSSRQDGKVDIQIHEESRMSSEDSLKTRVLPLEENEFLLPLTRDVSDPIAHDIGAIPYYLKRIQEDWKEGGLNRLTAWTLGRALRKRMNAPRSSGSVDILLTGCEVSLWLAEQFSADLSKVLPTLSIQSISSNKLLGLLGQELSVPSFGFPMSESVPDLKHTIVIIVSHSGGTFAPLAISNLLQSVTQNIFVVTSEWDCQVGKQLRIMSNNNNNNDDEADTFGSRIFATNIGVRSSEPSTLSVAATHQLLTQIFQYVCLVILKDQAFRDLAGAIVTETDLQILERCNQDNIAAMEEIVGHTALGKSQPTQVQHELRAAGNLWADHVLENARACILTFLYVVGTVTAGYPLFTGIAIALGQGSDSSHWSYYFTRALDGLLYFFIPQINILLIRLYQGRNLRHRMTGRTVVIGDIPWVSQSIDAFASKIFARSYSIAGLNVLCGNPVDHLVHRHTHRVVRGSLLVCGRPDGRLAALTSAECAVNLSVNQASSIQSLGGTCESITIGHNPSKLGLTKMDIALGRHRPLFLCEKILEVQDKQQNKGSASTTIRSASSLKGAYLGMLEHIQRLSNRSSKVASELTASFAASNPDGELNVEQEILTDMIAQATKSSQLHQIFQEMDQDGSGAISLDYFIMAYQSVHPLTPVSEIERIFRKADRSSSGHLRLKDIKRVLTVGGTQLTHRFFLARNHDPQSGLPQVMPSKEEYFGANKNKRPSINSFGQALHQQCSMELYESRIASLQRFVAMTVLFHQMGKRVQDFFQKYSFGLLGYKMERTHSIMRIATTASPVSGDAVRQQMQRLNIRAKYSHAVNTIHVFWRQYYNHRIPKEKVKDDRSDDDDDEEPAPHRQPTKALVGPSHRLSVRSQARVLLNTLEEHEQGRRRRGGGNDKNRPRRDAQEEIADDNRPQHGPLRAPMPRD